MKPNIAALPLLVLVSRRARIHTGMLLVSLALLACGDSGSATLPNGLPSKYPQVAGSNTMQATIDGVEWSGRVVELNRGFFPVLGDETNVLELYGTSNPFLGLTLRVVEVNGPGVYQLRRLPPAIFYPRPGSWAAVSLFGTEGTWYNTVGSVTVVEIGTSGARGTFSFTAEPATWSKAMGQLVVTNGRFDVTF